jgi:nucleoside-diphosphate-sugar epimerase
MKVLLVGGAGMVGSFVTPYLREHHSLRVLDLRAPRHEGVEYVEGSITDPESLGRALDGVDTFINMVMKSPQGGSSAEQNLTQIRENYEVNTLGLHLLLWTAQGMGIKRGVHTSTMSVHYRERPFFGAEEEVPLDTPSVYGLTKGFGELICAYFARWFDMNLLALRITGPRTRTAFIEERRGAPTDGTRHLYWTDEEDLARAYLAALDAVQTGHGRFETVFIAGDESQSEHNLSKARRLLQWEPRSQKYLV